jgi:hypothetical protein
MMQILVILSLLVSLCQAGTAAAGQISATENRLLELELTLAGTDRIYAVFDLPRKEIRIKAKGLLLVKIPLCDLKTINNYNKVEQVVLDRRTSFQKLARQEITPGKKETESTGKALELIDMPANYILHTRDGSKLRVLAHPQESLLTRFWHFLVWELTGLNAMITRRHGQSDITSGMLRLAPGDARALYWYFPEGTEALIVPAGAG